MQKGIRYLGFSLLIHLGLFLLQRSPEPLRPKIIELVVLDEHTTSSPAKQLSRPLSPASPQQTQNAPQGTSLGSKAQSPSDTSATPDPELDNTMKEEQEKAAKRPQISKPALENIENVEPETKTMRQSLASLFPRRIPEESKPSQELPKAAIIPKEVTTIAKESPRPEDRETFSKVEPSIANTPTQETNAAKIVETSSTTAKAPVNPPPTQSAGGNSPAPVASPPKVASGNAPTSPAPKTILDKNPGSNTAGDTFGDREAAPIGQLPKPVYPKLAQNKGIEGTVTLRIEVLATGRTGQVTVLMSSGRSDLDRAAIAAFKNYHSWQPKIQGGKATSSWVTLNVEFRLVD